MSFSAAAGENARLAALRSYHILDSVADKRFDRIVGVARRFFRCPMSAISFVDENRQWFKSRIGISLAETSRSLSFCAHAIAHDDVFVIEDATRDARFCTNPFVIGDPGIRFYAGAPLKTHEGLKLGTLCVIDNVARSIKPSEKEFLGNLSETVVIALELRKLNSVDCLTKAWNRHFFLEKVGIEIVRARRDNTPLSILALRTDNITPLKGHVENAVNEMMIDRLAADLRDLLCSDHLLGRIGQNTLAILLPHTDKERATNMARLVHKLLADRSVTVGTLELNFPTRMGMAHLGQGDDNLETLMQRLEVSLLEAKS